MPFCTNCGGAIKAEDKFCTSCGQELKHASAPAHDVKAAPKEKRTPEGKKLIGGGTKPTGKSPTKKAPARKPATKTTPKKKKKSSIGCFFRTLFILVSIIVGFALIIVVINVFFIEDDGQSTSNTQISSDHEDGALKGTDIPGIVDIEPETADTPEKSVTVATAPTKEEPKALGKAAKKIETAFANENVAQIEQLLTPTSAEKYKDYLQQIKPYMSEYAESFKKRKLLKMGDYYALYSITDDKGNVCTVEFAMIGENDWRLVRF